MESSATNVSHKYADFRMLYLIMQMIGAVIIILTVCWVFLHLNGLSWSATPAIQFNWHPLLMTIGMIYLYGNCKHLANGPFLNSYLNIIAHCLTLIRMSVSLHLIFFSNTYLSWNAFHQKTQLENHSRLNIWYNHVDGCDCWLGRF